MRLNNKTFKIGTFRRPRRKLGRISNFKWLEAALNLVEIKNPLDLFKLTPRLMRGGFRFLFFFEKKCFWNFLMKRLILVSTFYT